MVCDRVGTCVSGALLNTSSESHQGSHSRFQKKWIADPLMAPFQIAGNILTPKWKGKNLFGKENYWLMSDADRHARSVEMNNMRLNRSKRDSVHDKINILTNMFIYVNILSRYSHIFIYIFQYMFI